LIVIFHVYKENLFMYCCTFVAVPNHYVFRYDGLHHGSSYLEHLNFLSAIRAKGEQAPAVGLQDGLISVAIGVAAQLSIEKGRFVMIEEVMDEHKCD
jgi:hypothetical protein